MRDHNWIGRLEFTSSVFYLFPGHYSVQTLSIKAKAGFSAVFLAVF